MERLTSYFERREAGAPGDTGGLPISVPGGVLDSPPFALSPRPHLRESAPSADTNSAAAPELAALRWMVRGFFVVFAVLRLLDACGVRITLAGELSVLVGGLFVIAHMAATVIGTTRRNAAPDDAPSEGEAWLARRRRTAIGRSAAVPPSPTALRDDHPLGSWLLACILGGAACGAALMAAVTLPAWLRIGLGGVLILELSAATIGAYFGYMTGRLTATARRAWAEATAEASRRASDRGV